MLDYGSDTQATSGAMRARTSEYNYPPPDYGVSHTSMHRGNQIVNSMQERNRQMRSEAKMQN